MNRQGQTGVVAFGIEDNLKKPVGAPANMEGLNLFGASLVECLAKWGLSPWSLRFSGDASSCSLWNACLFPVCPDIFDSFSLTLETLQALQPGVSTVPLPLGTKLMSLQEALQCKKLEEMLKYRKKLMEDVKMKKWS